MYSIKSLLRQTKATFVLAKQIHEKYPAIPTCVCQMDIMYCIARYGVRACDYDMFQFYKKSRFERNRYMSTLRWYSLYKKMIKTVGDGGIGNMKDKEYEVFKDFIKRDWVIVKMSDSNDKIYDFLDSHETVIAKPVHGTFGLGIVKLHKGQSDKVAELLEYKKEDDYILEECIENDSSIAVLNPSSLNTLRVYTSKDSKGTHFLEICLRVGRENMTIDNWSSGGIGYHFNTDTGICERPGLDKGMNEYIKHPSSGIVMVGYQLPMFEELKEYVRRLDSVLPGANVVGWDIAITPSGFDFIEMNCPGGHDFLQIFDNPCWDILKKYAR